MTKSLICRAISVLICLQIALPPVSFAQEPSLPNFENPPKSDVTKEELDKLEAQLPEAIAVGSAIEDHLEAIAPQLIDAFNKVLALLEKEERELTNEALADFLRKNRLSIVLGDFGHAELRIVGTIVVVRVIENETQTAYHVTDKSQWPVNMEDLKTSAEAFEKLVANEHINSGKTRTDGQKNRDVEIVILNHRIIENHQSRPRPAEGTAEHRRAYRLSTFEEPTKGTAMLALVMGPLQAMLTYGVSICKDGWGGEWHTAAVNGVIGSVIALNYKSFQNVFGRPNRDLTSTHYEKPKNKRDWLKSDKVRRLIKKNLFSYSVTTLLYLAHHGFNVVTFINAQEVVFANLLMRSAGKDSYDQLGYVLREFNESSGNIRILGHDTGMPRDLFISDALQLFPTFLGALSIVAHVGVFQFHSLQLPWLYLALVPFMTLARNKYANSVAAKLAKDPKAYEKARVIKELADQNEERWKNTWGIDVKDIPKALSSYVQKKLSGLKDSPSCSQVLK